MFDRINIKAVIIVTAAAAVLSVAAGGIGGVSMGILLLRAFVFGLIFGIGAIITNVVVSTFLPELIGSETTQEEEEEDMAERGNNINIVMDDDNTIHSEANGTVPSDSFSSFADIEGEAENLTDSQGFKPASTQDIAGQQNGRELPDIGAFAIVDDDEDDIDSHQTTEATEAPGESIMKSRFSDIQSNDENKIEFFQNNTTAEELAKGVRTILKRDEKG